MIYVTSWRARLGRGGKGFLLGYLSLFLVDIEGFQLGHVEAPLNVNEKQLVEQLLTRVLGECIEVELTVGDSQLESQHIFDALEARKISHIIAWRRLKGRENPPDVLTDAPMVSGAPLPNGCENCRECVDACPVKAFTGAPFDPSEPRDVRFRAHLCSDYSERRARRLGEGLCGLCVYICPYGAKGKGA